MKNLMQLWHAAAAIDPTLRFRRRDVPALLQKRVKAGSFSRSQLFSRMAGGQICLFNDFPVSIKGMPSSQAEIVLPKLIKAGFPRCQMARTQTGPSRTLRKLKVGEVVRRWETGRAVIGVTDLHFRGTRFEEGIEYSALSDFDILCGSAELVHYIEMMTLVISSKGNYTDSHADDCDGSNHCFVGKKLWLAWDRIEGKAKGFQDVDRDRVKERARFDLRTFLSLPSARWFVVGPGKTLFLPGSLAHKVISLEHYIGIGGFHVALPSYIRSLKRWILYDTLDVNEKGLLFKINEAVIEKLRELQNAAKCLRERWGLSFLRLSIEEWKKNEKVEMKEQLLKHPAFAAFLEAAGSSLIDKDRREGPSRRLSSVA